MELMVPAGNTYSFISALEGDADSIYVGLKKYNARYAAENFTTFELIKALNLAHSKNKKVYLTLNIDLKSNELEDAVKILGFCAKIGIDAVIVKDLALIFIYNLFFKDKFDLHLSTQASLCSSLGVKYAKNINIKRVVLARELTLEEIKKCCEINDIEVEVFIQGSMCFSVSGRCLISSYIGGKSSNRGRCTAPCRILWNSNGEKKTYFSMKDLSLINNIKELKRIGVKGLKIEGRLKNHNWVSTITSFYKKILQDKNKEVDIERFKEELLKFSARDMDNGHLFKHSDLIQLNPIWEHFQKEEQTDIPNNILKEILKIIFEGVNNNLIKVTIIIEEYQQSFEIVIENFEKKKAKLHKFISIKEDLKFNINNLIKKYFGLIFINCENIEATSSFLKQIVESITKKVAFFYNKIESLFYEVDNKVLKFLKPISKIIRKKILGDYPNKIIVDYSQLDLLKNIPDTIDTIVVYINKELDLNILQKLKEKYDLIIAIPPVLFEEKVKKIKNIIEKLYNYGFTQFEANSFCGLEILKDMNCKKHLGIGLPLYNHIASRYYKELGCISGYCPLEGDLSIFKSLSNFSEIDIEIVVFARPELFISRVQSPYFKTDSLFSDKYIEIVCFDNDEIRTFVSFEPLSLIGEVFKKDQIMVNNLTADLRFFKNPEKTLNAIFNNEFLNTKKNSFNYFRKLS